MARKRQVSANQLQPFPHSEESSVFSPTYNQLVTRLTFLEEELRVGQMDYDRLSVSRLEFEQAARVKNHNRVRVDGTWYDVKFCKGIVRFLDGWRQRSSNLRYEIEQIRKQLR